MGIQPLVQTDSILETEPLSSELERFAPVVHHHGESAEGVKCRTLQLGGIQLYRDLGCLASTGLRFREHVGVRLANHLKPKWIKGVSREKAPNCAAVCGSRKQLPTARTKVVHPILRSATTDRSLPPWRHQQQAPPMREAVHRQARFAPGRDPGPCGTRRARCLLRSGHLAIREVEPASPGRPSRMRRGYAR